MRGVFPRSGRVAAACLLIVVLLAPSAFASDTSSDESLWAEFVAWVDAGLGVSDGVTAADESGFSAWLMARIGVGGG
jgi:hypothetical protein